jgi:endonuclease I
MKIPILLLLLFLSFNFINSQENYYTDIDGLYGDQLNNRLHTIIRGHKKYPYTSTATDTWDILKQTDRDTINADNVILIYSGWTINGEDEYNSGSGWSREHIWPKSHGFPSESDTAYTDVHHLRPCDVSINSARGNKDYDNGGSQVIDGDGPTNCYSDSDSWEPRNEVKGDCARMILYMSARYGNSNSFNLEIVDYTGTPTDQPILGKLSTLLDWNRFDPPDDFERNRNEVIYAFQNNRNPFVDCPEFADRIYSDGLVIEGVQLISQNQFVIKFNTPLETSSAENIANYFIDKSIGYPLTAVHGYNEDQKSVLLTVNPLNTNENYIIKVNNVTCNIGNTIIDNSILALNIESSFPVELISFSPNVSSNTVKLFWNTATELNNYGFEIQRTTEKNRSADGWEIIGFVNGNSTSNTPKDYSFVDSKLAESNSYFYRLKQVDNDGSYEYSKIIEVVIGEPAAFKLDQNFPNPFNPSTIISFTLPENGFTRLNVYNSIGQEVVSLVNEKLESGYHQYNFNAADLTSGVYFYKLESGNFVKINKMLLLK